MNKNKRTILIIVISIIVLLFVLLGISIILFNKVINNASNIDYYALGNDKVISITNVVGKRKVNKINNSKSNGIITKKYTYTNITNPKSDISRYIEELKNNNFINTTDINLSKDSDIISLASPSITKDNIIIVTIEYDLGTYTITLKKGKGSIQQYG